MSSTSPAGSAPWRYFLALSLVSGTAMLMELTLTKVFAVMFFNHFAFIIISNALFGLGLSGVFLSVTKVLDRFELDPLLSVMSCLLAISELAAFKLLMVIPLSFIHFGESWLNYLYLVAYYLVIAVPFFFAGLIITLLLGRRSDIVNRLYFFDLIGAGASSIALVLLLPPLGAEKLILFAAVVAGIAAILFGVPHRRMRILAPLCAVATIIVFLYLPAYFQMQHFDWKRGFEDRLTRGKVEMTRWSAISRIDVAPDIQGRKKIFIDGGSCEGIMVQVKKCCDDLQPIRSRLSLPFELRPYSDVLIVGSSGGREVLMALSHKASSITAVEIDPSINQIVTGHYAAYIGRIFEQPSVTLVTDEGRSYIRRSRRQYDLIQQVYNTTPAAIASGAMNFAESYLLTKEAVVEYLDHLTDSGLLSVMRPGAAKVAILCSQALMDRGVEDPGKHLIMLQSADGERGWVLMRKTPFVPEDMPRVYEYGERENYSVAFSPFEDKPDPFLARALRAKAGDPFWDMQKPNFTAPTDNQPFFERFHRLFGGGDGMVFPGAVMIADMLKSGQRSDRLLYSVLIESIVLSTLFVVLPLYVFHRRGLKTRYRGSILAYFAGLGAAFIIIEICLLQRFTLFLGYPVYSITFTLCSLLVFAGIGSNFAGRYKDRAARFLRLIIPLLFALNLIEMFVAPYIFRAFIGHPMWVRGTVSVIMIAPLGFFMGMPFPLGLHLVTRRSSKLVPWAWGVNGYATVIGSPLCVFLAILMGFKLTLLLAGLIYLSLVLAVPRLEGADS
ncbi:MAG: hypothetical protein AB1714_19905 [Acidobacteriota bacterium]